MNLLTPQDALGETIHHLVYDIFDLAGRYHASETVTQFFFGGELIAERVQPSYEDDDPFLTGSLRIWIPNGPTITFSEEELEQYQIS